MTPDVQSQSPMGQTVANLGTSALTSPKRLNVAFPAIQTRECSHPGKLPEPAAEKPRATPDPRDGKRVPVSRVLRRPDKPGSLPSRARLELTRNAARFLSMVLAPAESSQGLPGGREFPVLAVAGLV